MKIAGHQHLAVAFSSSKRVPYCAEDQGLLQACPFAETCGNFGHAEKQTIRYAPA